MKRDMELVRKIMFRLEELDGQHPFESSMVTVDGYDAATIGYHCALLKDCGYIYSQPNDSIGSPVYFEFFIERLTSAGHDFIDAARSDTVWNRTISTAKEKGVGLTIELTMQFLKSVAKDILNIH